MSAVWQGACIKRMVDRNSGAEVSRGLRQGLKKMRFSLAVAIVVAGISVTGVAQQNRTFKVKHSAPEKAPKSSAPIAKTSTPATASSTESKDLKNLEHQTAKTTASHPSGGKAPALKLAKDKPNPPINFGGGGGNGAGKSSTTTNQSANALAGRLKKKPTHQ